MIGILKEQVMQHNTRNNKIANSENVDAELNKKGIVDMETYKQNDTGAAAFRQVMSQMNIADRNAFDKQFSQQWNKASANKELLSVLVCEIDFFKEYNENYGQQGASFMLLVIALALKNICEENGYFLAQYNKEEFAILIRGGDPEKIAEVAENLRQSVEKSNTEHKYSKISKIVTLSIGVSSMYPKSMQMLMKLTNKALYNAKESGRNKVFGHFPENEATPTAKETTSTPIIEESINETKELQSKDKPVASELDNIDTPEMAEIDKKEFTEIEKIITSEQANESNDKEPTLNTDDELLLDIEDSPEPPKKKMFRLDIDEFFNTSKDKKVEEKKKPAAKAKKSKFKGSVDIDGGMF